MNEEQLAKLPRVEEVLKKFQAADFETQENRMGDVTIKPATRRQMKKELMAALLDDLNEAFDIDLCETLINDDGMMMIVNQVNEGYITIEVNCKIKNLDYDPLY